MHGYKPDSSNIEDAHIAIDFVGNGGFKITNSNIINNVTGINVPANDSCDKHNDIQGYVTGTKFGLFKTQFAPDYINQPPHGIKPFTGISMVDMLFTLGDNNASKNTFHNLNCGIVACQSDIKIYNSTFDNIVQDNFYAHPWRGTAMVSLSGLCALPGTLTVHPNAANNIVANGHRSVYTDNSNIDISGTKMLSVVYGIYTKSCNLGLSANIVANTITSSAIAIDMIDNAGATTLLVNGNTINMTDQGFCTAVRASEISNSIAKYIISDNTINMKTMGWGIMAQK
nr:hypothetical protein [Bacteroidota bacterium]